MSLVAQAKEPHPGKVTVFPASITPVVIMGAGGWTFSIAFFVVQAIVQAASARPFNSRPTSSVISATPLAVLRCAHLSMT
jgi:hypothetical protein